MNRVRPGASNGVDDAARRTTIFRRVVAGENREFLYGVRAQIHATCTARRAICIIVNADSVDAVVILLWTMTRNSQLISIAAIATRGCPSTGILCADT